MIMELDKYIRAESLLSRINYNERRVQRINDFLMHCNDRISPDIYCVLGDDFDYTRLDNTDNEELKAYRDGLEKVIEYLKKEFEEL